MQTKIMYWDNTNGHRAFKMAVTTNIIGTVAVVPVGWKITTGWERGLFNAIKQGHVLSPDHFLFTLTEA